MTVPDGAAEMPQGLVGAAVARQGDAEVDAGLGEARGPEDELARTQPVMGRGADPADLAAAARIGAELGYDEINLNVGCPSDRVQSGRFGACLMAEPEIVAECVRVM